MTGENKKVSKVRCDIGGRIGQVREMLGLTQADLASLVGESPRTVTHWENATRDIRTESLIKLSEALHVSTDFLLGLTEIKSPNVTVQGIHKEIGLSESSILVLQALKDCEDTGANITELLSALIVDTGQNMISTLSLIASASNALVILTKDPTYEQTLSGEVDVNGLYWKCQNVFTSFIGRYVKNMQGEES